MNLVVDIGNTLVKIGIIQKNKVLEHHTQETLKISFLEELRQKYPNLKKVIISSVKKNPEELINHLKKHFSPCIFFDADTLLPIQNLYESKETLGYDRIAACIGANYFYPNNNLLVIDEGTALTFDFVNDKNQYVGGAISPGLTMRFKALHHFTDNLPLLEKNANFNVIGKNTTDAIVLGVQNGIIFEIDEYISRLRTKNNNLKVILTGGDAIFFEKTLKNTIFVLSQILLIGLNRILDYNAK